MDMIKNPIDYRNRVNNNAHMHMINENNYSTLQGLYPNTNPNVEMHSGIYMYHSAKDQIANNFVGRKYIRPEPLSYASKSAVPLSGKWNAPEHIPIMRTYPVIPKFSPIC